MPNSFKKIQFVIAAFISIPIMVFLAWGGLTLPFDFQPDPNYSHVLNGLHLADTGRFENTFYPGVLNFYMMALFNLLAGVTLPSSPVFGIDSLQKATYVARSSQMAITIFAMWGWMYALSTLIQFRKNDERERLAYSIALVATLSFMVFSYAFIYEAYFLRPDNALSLCIALGFALFATMRQTALESGRLKTSHLLYVGIWMFSMTATKSQGQALIAFGILYVFFIAVRWKLAVAPSHRFMGVLRAAVAITLAGTLVIVARGLEGYTEINKFALWTLLGLLSVILLVSLLSRAAAAVVALHITAAWCACLILMYLITKGQTPQVIELANPINSFIIQTQVGNLKIEARPIIFHLQHAGIYGMVPLFLCFAGAIVFRKKSMFLLIGVGLLMILTTSLRLPGFYNGILYLPFFFIAAGLSLYHFFNEKFKPSAVVVVFLLIGCHVAANVTLHTGQITALHAACLNRGSLVGVRYDPDAINLRYTIRNEGWAEYSQHYFTVITDFGYWPEIRDKLKKDKKFDELLAGTLTTCPLE